MTVSRAVTIAQPQATLLAEGFITAVGRPTGTPYRGRLYIHTSAATGAHEPELFPAGLIVAVARLVDVTEPLNLSELDETLGGFPARWAWRFVEVAALDIPVPARGAAGVWSYEGPGLRAEREPLTWEQLAIVGIDAA